MDQFCKHGLVNKQSVQHIDECCSLDVALYFIVSPQTVEHDSGCCLLSTTFSRILVFVGHCEFEPLILPLELDSHCDLCPIR